MNNRNVIKTSHELNHFKGGYTRLELDFIYAFISTIKDEDEKFRSYSLTLEDLEKKLGKRLQFSKIRYIFNSLIKKSFEVNNSNELEVYSFFTYLKYDKKTKNITVDFNERLKPHLLKLNKYAMGNLKYILEFKSEYTKRIYMLMCQWKTATKIIYTVDEIRNILAVPKSHDYANFKRKILKVAEKEMIEKGDIFFEYEEIKTGRKVTELLFRIKDNTRFLKPSCIDAEVENSLNMYVGKKLKTKDGGKEISFIKQGETHLNINFLDGGYAEIENIEMLKRALI